MRPKQRVTYGGAQEGLRQALIGVSSLISVTSLDELVEEDIINKISNGRTH